MPIAFGFQYAGPRVRACTCIGMVRSPKATLSYHMRADELPVAGRLSTSSDPGAHDILVVWMPVAAMGGGTADAAWFPHGSRAINQPPPAPLHPLVASFRRGGGGRWRLSHNY